MDVIVVENTTTDVIEALDSSPSIIEIENQTVIEYPVTIAEQIDVISQGAQGPPTEHETNDLNEIRFKNPDGTWGSWIAIAIDGGTF
jgi:hypothetical protein